MYSQGNSTNQLVVFDNKVCDYINHILRGAQFQGCSQKEVHVNRHSNASSLNIATYSAVHV